jgi:hypothetical protein
LLDEVKAAYALQAAQRGAATAELRLTLEEKRTPRIWWSSKWRAQAAVADAGLALAVVPGLAAVQAQPLRLARPLRRWPRRAGQAGAPAAGAAAGVGNGKPLAVPAGQAPAGGRGAGGGRGGGFGGPSLPQEMNAEFALLLPKRMTVLEIRDFLSGEFTPLPLADLMSVLRAREAAGTVRLVRK